MSVSMLSEEKWRRISKRLHEVTDACRKHARVSNVQTDTKAALLSTIRRYIRDTDPDVIATVTISTTIMGCKIVTDREYFTYTLGYLTSDSIVIHPAPRTIELLGGYCEGLGTVYASYMRSLSEARCNFILSITLRALYTSMGVRNVDNALIMKYLRTGGTIPYIP